MPILLSMNDIKDEKLLIVDAKASRRDSIATRFRLQGFKVELSNSGFQCLSLIEKEDYKNVIIFGNAPDMPAIELISLIRDRNKKDKLQILFVDKSAEQNEVLEYFKLGVNDFIVYNDKIFAALLEKINKFRGITI